MAFNFKAFFALKVIRFVLITLVRIVGIIAICMVLGAEMHEMIRNIQGYVKAAHTDSSRDASINQTTVIPADMFDSSNASDVQVQSFREACGYIEWTSVPDHAAGILFSTLFRFLNLLVLLLLGLSELSIPWTPVTNFFLRFFPPLSEDASTGFLGAAMLWISTSILSTNVQAFATVAAWFLFVLGIINLLLSLIMGSSIRKHRSLIESDKSKRPELPIAFSNAKVSKKGKVSYPAPADISNIGFPTPAYGFNNHSRSTTLSVGNDYNDFSTYVRPAVAAGPLTRPSEMLEKRANSPIAVGRTRSGKGILKIRTPEEEQEDADDRDHDSRTPPSYPH